MHGKVLIMMATYNGEAYIDEQIKSIVGQTYTNWELAIQDDQSKDGTIEIIKQYEKNDNRIKLYINDSDHHGPFCNFHSLANRFKNDNKFDYYMFCDQDDIWLPQKTQMLINAIKDKEVPALAFADMSMCNAKGMITVESVNKTYKMAGRDEYNVFFAHKVFGCNLIMNKKLFSLVPIIDITKPYVKTLSHDNLYTKFAATKGEIVFLPEATMLYRRHEKNATSKSYYKISVSHLIKRAFQIIDLAKSHTIIYNQSIVAINMLNRTELSDDEKRRINEIKDIIYKGGIQSLAFLKKHKIGWGRKSEDFSRRVILLTGMYKRYLVERDIL